jgi:membrane associated rhomboid family serine protease
MVIPIYDTDPLEGKSVPYVTYGLIAANIVVFLAMLVVPNAKEPIELAYGFIPQAFFYGSGWSSADTLLTHMFLHDGWEHIIGNMLFLWVFGDNIEDAVGHLRYFGFYLVCGICAALVHGLIEPHSAIPLVGASGAIAGTVAAYLMLRPCAKVEVLLFLVIPKALDAYWVLGFWVLLQVWEVVKHSPDGVAWWAHIGGLAAGAVLIPFMRKPGVELFACVEPGEGQTGAPA